MKIQIEVPDRPAVLGADKIAGALGRVEAAGAKAGAATATGMKNASTAAMAAVQPVNILCKSVGSLAEALRRESEMFKSIRGDMQGHVRDLQTLDAMMRKGTITANEYAAAVAKSQSINGLPAAAAGAGDAARTAAGIGSLNFKAAAAGAAQGFELLNQKLHITENKFGSVVGSAIKFGAMGAQVAGPWGAALGAVAGIAADLVSQFTDAEAATRNLREEQQKLATEYWEGIRAGEQKKRVEEFLAPALAEHAKYAAEAAEAEKTLRGVLDSQDNTYRTATDKLRAYEKQLQDVNAELGINLQLEEDRGLNPLRGGGQSTAQAKQVIAGRGVLDARTLRDASTVSFGDELIKHEMAARGIVRERENLEALLGSGLASAEGLASAQKRLNEIYRGGNKLLERRAELLDPDNGARNMKFESVYGSFGAPQFDGGRDKFLPSMLQGRDGAWVGTSSATQGLDVLKTDYTSVARTGNTSLTDPDTVAKLAEQTKSWHDRLSETKDSLAELNEIGTTAFSSFSDSIGRMAASGTFSFRSMVDSMIADLARLATQKLAMQLIGSLGSLGSSTSYGPGVEAVPGGSGGYAATGKMPGYATGGDFMVAGAGGTDSRIVAFRATPGESVHVRTPQHRAQAARSSSGSRVVSVVYQPPDRRALMANIVGAELDTAVVDVLRRNPGAVSSLIGGKR